VRLKVHSHNLLVIAPVLFQHIIDIELINLQVNEKVMLYNNYFDHEVVQQIQHVKHNQYLFELLEEVMEYLQMMLQLEMLTERIQKIRKMFFF
jgi:hypothetical protein